MMMLSVCECTAGAKGSGSFVHGHTHVLFMMVRSSTSAAQPGCTPFHSTILHFKGANTSVCLCRRMRYVCDAFNSSVVAAAFRLLFFA